MDAPLGLPRKTSTSETASEIDLFKLLEFKAPRGLDTLRRPHALMSTPIPNSGPSHSSAASLHSTNDLYLIKMGQEANSKEWVQVPHSININIRRNPKGKSKIHNSAKCDTLGGITSREAGHIRSCLDGKIRLHRGKEPSSSIEYIDLILGMQPVITFGNARRSLESWDGISTPRSAVSCHGQAMFLTPVDKCLPCLCMTSRPDKPL